MLVTLSDMKSYLNISDNSQDAFLTDQLNLVSDTIEAYCRRVFNVATYEQTFYYQDYEPVSKMELFHFPLVSVTSIVEDGTTLSTSEYRVNLPTGIIHKDCGFFYAKQTVVTYSAGFATLPSPVKSVVYSVVEERYNKKSSGVNLNFGSDVQRISIPGAISIDFDYSLSNNDRKTPFGLILGNHLNVLDHYRSERAVVGSGKLVYIA